jgi:hypothetical protein
MAGRGPGAMHKSSSMSFGIRPQDSIGSDSAYLRFGGAADITLPKKYKMNAWSLWRAHQAGAQNIPQTNITTVMSSQTTVAAPCLAWRTSSVISRAGRHEHYHLDWRIAAENSPVCQDAVVRYWNKQ